MSKHSAKKDFVIMWCMIFAVMVPIAFTLRTIHNPGMVHVDWDTDPTPYGYTWSLTLFIVPAAMIAIWFLHRWRYPVQGKAFFLTTAVIFIGGTTLDILFGYAFFKFPNPGATLGIRLPAFSFSKMGWKACYLPIEEFGFYLFGALYTLELYVWGDLYWFAAYKAERASDVEHSKIRFIRPHWRSLITAVLLILLAILIKKHGVHEYKQGFPGYAVFLILIAVLPSLVLFRAIKDYINWRSFGFVYFNLMWLSFFWEASLAARFGWWTYRPDQMMGIMFHEIIFLPVEAVLLWLAITWPIVIFYETFCLYFFIKLAQQKAAGQSIRDSSTPRPPDTNPEG